MRPSSLRSVNTSLYVGDIWWCCVRTGKFQASAHNVKILKLCCVISSQGGPWFIILRPQKKKKDNNKINMICMRWISANYGANLNEGKKYLWLSIIIYDYSHMGKKRTWLLLLNQATFYLLFHINAAETENTEKAISSTIWFCTFGVPISYWQEC